jgi:hypothetical protein
MTLATQWTKALLRLQGLQYSIRSRFSASVSDNLKNWL